MGEQSAVDRVDEPVTVPAIVDDLHDLGVRAGDTLLVHASLSAMGWVCGGPQAVVDALQEAVTDAGTLVLPTHSGQYTDPASWKNPPVPDDWVATIRESRPAFRPAVSPTRGMGAVPECFRNYPGAVRSRHPEVSFAAWGNEAEAIVSDHGLDFGLGENSPLARVYERGGDVLMLGTDYDTNTSLHLAEYRAELGQETVTYGVPVIDDGERVRVEVEDIVTSTDDFPTVGEAFEEEQAIDSGTIGDADATLLYQPGLVDFAVEWFEANR